jgi:hypothetical protein
VTSGGFHQWKQGGKAYQKSASFLQRVGNADF